MHDKNITVLVDNDSWILPYARKLVEAIQLAGFDAALVRDAVDIQHGWINFMLGCTRIVGDQFLRRNEHNLVVHESALPKGRGFAPMTWQILQGERQIPICLLEANDEVDGGAIWLQDVITLQGHELCDEWRALQGEKSIEMCLRFLMEYPTLQARKQHGTPTNYPRRRPEDSRLNPDMSLRELFPMFRVADNRRYPAFFEIDGRRYLLQITRAE